jgi:CHASE3 domain sensor protein
MILRPFGNWLASIRAQLFLAFLVLVGLTVAVAGYAIWDFRAFSDAINDVIETSAIPSF